MNTPSRKAISSHTLKTILDLQEQHARGIRWIKAVESELQKLEAEVLVQLEQGESVPTGYDVGIRKITRRNVSWKSEFIEKLGSKVAAAVLKRTPATITKHLVVRVAVPQRKAA